MLTNEELLKHRYKVIADYPGSEFELNEIIYSDEEGYSIYYNYAGRLHIHLKSYPHLFAPIPWWADRKPEDLPEYVKKADGEIRKIKQHFCDSKGEPNGFGCQLVIDEKIEKEVWNYFPYRNLLPASSIDYLNYQNTKK